MKKITPLIYIILASFLIIGRIGAQVPQKFSYQAVVRNNLNELIKNTGIGMQISILQASPTGTAVYVERHFPTTSAAGLVTIEIGAGVLVYGSFTTIDWSSGTYYMKTEIDLNGGATYTISGTSQILSVPYALYAETAGDFSENDPVWSDASSGYYTKTNMQTAGQAQLNWGNLTDKDADITDLEDGALTGSKVGTGINATNITTGILALTNGGTGSSTASGARTNLGLGALATLDAVGSGQITDGSITSSDVNSISADKISGITDTYIPRSNGSGLVYGLIRDNGTSVGVDRSPVTNVKLFVDVDEAGINHGIYSDCHGITGGNVGVVGSAQNGTGQNVGLYGVATSSSTGLSTGIGLYATVSGDGVNQAIYGSAAGGSVNWAGYFNAGDVHISNQIEASALTSASSGATTLVLESGWIRKYSSDSHLKENIVPLTGILEKVLQLQGVNFTWRSDDSHIRDIGFLAQDVQKVFPELVVRDQNDGLLSVKYMNMTAVLTEAIKEQQKEIETIRQQNQELIEQLRYMQKRLDNIEPGFQE